jgi:hypothetical protein
LRNQIFRNVINVPRPGPHTGRLSPVRFPVAAAVGHRIDASSPQREKFLGEAIQRPHPGFPNLESPTGTSWPMGNLPP